MKCKKCGRCCHFTDEKGIIHKCPYLKKDNTCKNYDERLGRILGKVSDEVFCACTLRTNIPFDFKNCPYNSGKPFKEVGY